MRDAAVQALQIEDTHIDAHIRLGEALVELGKAEK